MYIIKNKGGIFSQEQSAFIEEHYTHKGSLFCATQLGFTPQQICTRAHLLGLKKIWFDEKGRKICGHCKKYKKPKDFPMRDSKKGKISARCRKCCTECTREYLKIPANRERLNRNRRDALRKNPSFCMGMLISCKIREAIKGQTGEKNKNYAEALLGIPIMEYREYIKDKFIKGMAWENYGEWDIDHIKPLSSFDLTDPEQQKICFYHTNTQPLWEEDNQKKGAKIVL